MKKISKTEAKEIVEKFFKDIKNKNPYEIKKIKKLAMSQNIKLKEMRKKFCKKCFSSHLKIVNTKNKIKKVKCENCGNISRWKINSS